MDLAVLKFIAMGLAIGFGVIYCILYIRYSQKVKTRVLSSG